MRLIISPILILAAIGLFVWYINPMYADVQGLESRQEEFDRALTQSQELKAVRDALLAKYNTFPASDLARLRRILPDHVDNVRLILEIDRIASEYGMVLQGITVGETGSAGEGTLGADTSPTGAITLSFSVRAPYESFQQFLMDLEDSLRLVDVIALSVETPAEGLPGYTLTLRTYWLK